MVTGPAGAPVIVLVATPEAGVALPSQASGAGFRRASAKATTVVVVGGDGVAGGVLQRLRSGTRVAPEVRLVVAPVSAIWVAGSVDDGEGAEGAGGEAGGGGFHCHRADEPRR